MSSKVKEQGRDGNGSRRPRQPAAGRQPTRERPRTAGLVQRAGLAPESLTRKEVLQLQRAAGNRAVGRLLAGAGERQTIQRKENKTGLPDSLKAGVERLSGLSLDDVRVHYNASQPARFEARAYTSGADIYVGPGQETNLAHEAWHVVQQKQGRVRPTVEFQGAQVNDQESLEREADEFGERALGSVRTTAAAADEGPMRDSPAEPPGLS